MKEPQVWNIFLAFVAGLVIIYVVARVVGEENKKRWFKKREGFSFLNRRGFLGETWHFGYPRTWQGALVIAVMYTLILAISYAIVFML